MGGYFHVDEALDVAEQHPNIVLETSAMPYPDKIAEAVNNYQDALDLYRDLGRKDEEVSVLSQLGTMAMDVGQVRDAMVLYADALEVAAESGQRPAAVRLYGRLARLARGAPDGRPARQPHRAHADLDRRRVG